MKQAMRKQIERFGVTPQNVMLHFANSVDENTRKLALQAYNELLKEV